MKKIPCHNCLTLAICQNKSDDVGHIGALSDLIQKCSVLKAHLQLHDIKPQNQILLKPRRIGKTIEAKKLLAMQSERINNIVKFMGWQLPMEYSDKMADECSQLYTYLKPTDKE